MRRVLPIAALVAALALVVVSPVWADDDEKLTDQEFVNKAAACGMFEVKAAQFAIDKKASNEVQKFARHVIEDHTKANQELRELAARKNLTFPMGLDAKQVEQLGKLGKVIGDDFNKDYARCQVEGHEKAIKMFERQAKDGKDSDLKEWAEKKVKTLKEHLKMAKDLDGAEGKKDRDKKDE